MWAHRGVRADLHMRADHAIGPDADRAIELCCGINDGRRMDERLRHVCTSDPVQTQAIFRIAQVKSASSANSVPTKACALYLKMPAFMRS